MNPVRKAIGWLGLKAAGYGGISVGLTSKDEIAWRKWSGAPSHAGKNVTEQTAMQITAVWGCVRLIAETVGAMPWSIYEQDKSGNSQKVDSHPLADVLLGSPNSDMTSLEMKEANTANLALRGNGYSLIERNGAGNVASIYPVAAANVDPRRSDDGTIFYRINDRGRWENYPQEKIWHWRGFGFSGLAGLSPIGAAREAMGLALGAEEFGARLFQQGATPSAIVSIPSWLNPDQRKVAKDNLTEMYAGLVNAHKPMLLEGGMTVQPGMFPPEDLQFLQLRLFQVREIARLFRIDPHMIADLERATHNNIEQLSLEFVMYTMLPYLRRIEESAQKWLFKPGERGRFFLRFNFEGLLRADSVARGQLYSTMLQNGVYNRNEVRALENRNRSDAEGMDDYTVQSNMALIQMLDLLVAQRTGAPAAPAAGAVDDPAPVKARNPGDERIEIIAIRKLAAEVAASLELSSRTNAITLEALKDLSDIKTRLDAGAEIKEIRRVLDEQRKNNATLEKSLLAVAADAKKAGWPRKPIYDAAGELIGAEPVEKLH